MNDPKAQLRGVPSSLEKLESEYEKGALDVGRYLRLKTDYEARKTELERALAHAPAPARLGGRRALALQRWLADADRLQPHPLVAELPQLPPLPMLSLDPTDQVEQAFARADVSLQVLRSRRDTSSQERHALLKLGGDLPARSGVVLSRAEIRQLHSDPDKRHLLDEARRLAGKDIAVLMLGCDPANEDWLAWWAVLESAFSGASLLALGEPGAAWPPGITCLGDDFEELRAALWEMDAQRNETAGADWEPFTSPVPSDEAQSRQAGSLALVLSRLDELQRGQTALAEQLGLSVNDLKRGQGVLYRQMNQAYRDDLERILVAVRQGRVEHRDMQATLEALRQAMGVMLHRGLPMDAELRAVMADLTEAVESSLSLEQKLELSLPLFPPFLEYKIELAVDSETDLHAVWDELRERWRGLKGAV
jgi:hypothetical protein